MNQPTQVIATLEHYKVAIRDTLEYTLNKEAYNLDAFKEKKRSVLIEVEQPTPLKSIINASGENGQKLEKMIRDFYDDVYGDESTILKAADDGLRVDHAQHIAIFKGVVPIHENIEAMVSGIIRDAKGKGIDVSQAEAADLAEERLYRGVCYLTMVGQLVRLFNDYNVARREAKGEESPASKFIGNDISEVITLINTVRANNRLTDERYMGVQDKVFALVEYMTGRRDLPTGKGFPEVIRETEDSINGFIREVEPLWKQTYDPLIRELVEIAKAQQAKAEQPAEAAPADQGEPVELDPKTGLPK
ncbi:MAG: hypothetical protein IKQ78_03175 [Bacilli bacterium]|nr:hypothetical protein [Bacilli bacterium]